MELKVFCTKDKNGDLWASDLPPFIDNGNLIFEHCDDYSKCPKNWANADWFKDMKPGDRKTLIVNILKPGDTKTIKINVNDGV